MLKNTNMIPEKKYNILRIGVGIKREQYLSIQIDTKYIPALKYLSLFSHAIIIYQEKIKGKIFQETLKIISVNEKTGVCVFSKPLFQVGSVQLLDIKPYFPCEDRVLNSTFKISNPKGKRTVVTTEPKECGKIKKRHGETFIKMDTCELIESIAGCSHIRIFWWFSKFDKPVYRRATECDPPYENAPRTGIFASRSPVRPNPIALTTAKILSIDFNSNTIKTSALDCFDNSPVIGIAPYNPETDKIEDFFVPQWLEHWPPFFISEESNNNGLVDAEISVLEKIRAYTLPEPPENIGEIFSTEKPETSVKQAISVLGARQNNLKNVNVTIPYNKITVVTGVSGSGKSSLVFDTIYAESQYRFFENMSVSQRPSLKQIRRPEFDAITGLTPAIAVSQTNVSRNPRSTFGTLTGLYDLLRALYAGIGTRHCPKCGKAIIPLTPDFIAETLAKCKKETVLTLSPFGNPASKEKIVVKDNTDVGFYSLLRQKVSENLKIGKGAVSVMINETENLIFQTTQMCYDCNYSFFELTPSTFSFNNPESSCPVCNGTGEISEINPNLIVSHPELSILDNASSFWGNLRKFMNAPNANWMKGEVLALAQNLNVNLELPWNKLPDDFKHKALFGSNGETVSYKYKNTNVRMGEISRPAEGAVNILKRLLASGSGTERILDLYASSHTCPACQGEKLNKEGRLVTVAQKRLPEIVNMPVFDLKQWIESLPQNLGANEILLVKPILKEIHRLSENLILAGLSYITLNRRSSTLSGGELQRTRLVTQLGSGITNVSYILDEPFTGLHHKDVEKLFNIIYKLKETGNTIIMVEHNRFAMLKADNIIDVGPGAGIYGGRILAEGTHQSLMKNPNSETGQYLSEKKTVSLNKKYTPDFSKQITLKGARSHNLKNIEISFPVGAIICISGVSGSGKSSLVEDCLYPAVNAQITGQPVKNKQYDEVIGAEYFDKIIIVDQKPIGRNSRSNLATYTGLMDEIRSIFANTEAAKQKGFKASRFSCNNKEGQCQECSGEGVKRVNLPYISDSEVECPCCRGKQFNKETLDVEYKGKNIADVLQMSADEALNFFCDKQKAVKILHTLHEIGLGYIKLRQNSSSISGGEAQRIKLATELCSFATGNVLYILDEPSSGLHFKDVSNLMTILQKIATDGNTVVMVEHNEDIIKNADVIIELGPEGGENGGYILRQEILRTA